MGTVQVALRGGGGRRPRRHRPNDRPSRCGATVRGAQSSTPRGAISGGGGAAGRSASSAVSDDNTAKLWTLDGALERTFQVGSDVDCVAALLDGCTLWSALAARRQRARSAVPRRRDARPHLRGAHRLGDGGGGDARRQHIISGSHDKLVKVWSVASKSLVHLRRAHRLRSRGGDARRPAHPQQLGRQTVRCGASTAPSRHVRAAHRRGDRPRGAADNQHALSGSLDNTVKLFNVNDGAVLRTFKHHTTRGLLAAARRPPLRQRLVGQHRPHRLPRPPLGSVIDSKYSPCELLSHALTPPTTRRRRPRRRDRSRALPPTRRRPRPLPRRRRRAVRLAPAVAVNDAAFLKDVRARVAAAGGRRRCLSSCGTPCSACA